MKVYRRLVAAVYPERCPYCNKLIEACEIACKRCYQEIQQKRLPLKGGAMGFRCVSAFVYDGKVRRMILRLKYYDRTQYIPQIAELLADDIRSSYGEDAFDLITAVPMYPKDIKRRGYNQSVLLAKELGKLLSLPYRDTLQKIKRTKKQHHLKYAERKTNLNGAFRLIDKDSLRGQRILLIDDIITSGNTLGNCCKVLSRSKPVAVCCATIASAHCEYPASTII